MSDRNQRLRKHSYNLLLGTLLALLLSWGVAQLYAWFPFEPNPETRAFKVVVWIIIFHIVMLLIWTSIVLEDILKSEKDKRYQRLASFLLFLPYLPLLVLMLWKFTEGVTAFIERQKLMEEVGTYAYRPWEEHHEALWSGPTGDSLVVLLKQAKNETGRRLYLTEAGEALTILGETQLKEYRFYPDDRLLPQPHVSKLPSSQDEKRVLIPLPAFKSRYQAINSLVNDELVILDTMGTKWNDTIPGFHNFLVRASYRKPPVYEDSSNHYWFMIWEQTATVSPEHLYLVSYRSRKSRVFSIKLQQEHRASFSANRIRGLYVTGRNAFVLSTNGYLYFRLPTFQ